MAGRVMTIIQFPGKGRSSVGRTSFLIAVMALLFIESAAASEPLTGVASVIDGDTLEVHGQRIRLLGIDAPESRQICVKDGKSWRCGNDAAFILADKIGRKPVSCEPKGKLDRYGRVIAVCRQGNEDLNAWMVRQGWAMAYQQYSKAYVAEEANARDARRGIWASEFAPPWEWRKQGRKR